MEIRDRGRPRKIDPHIVIGTSDVLRTQLAYAWPTMGEKLLIAKTAEEVWEILKSGRGVISNVEGFEFSQRMFEIIKDRKFPRARAKSQINFLADSLAGQGFVTSRRSREICAKERSKKKYFIVRRDYYIECTCGYEGPALDGACRNCGTLLLSDELMRREEYETY